MQSVKYLHEVKNKYGLATDMALGEKIGVGRSAISHYMKGLRVMDNETCVAVAMALEYNEQQTLKVIMCADMDRAEKAGQQSLWTVFSQRMAATAASAVLAAGVTLFLTPQNAEARTYSPTSSAASEQFILCKIECRTHALTSDSTCIV